MVVGGVRLWGKVTAAERGWRGEHAYPDAIYVPSRTPEQELHKAVELATGLRDCGVLVRLLRWRTTPEIIASLARAA